MRAKLSISDYIGLSSAIRRHPRYQNCVGHWRFVEGGGTTLYNFASQQPLFNATVENATLSSFWSSSWRGRAASFNGTTDRAQVPHTTLLQPTSQLTMSAWITIGTAPNTFPLIMGKTDNYSLQTFNNSAQTLRYYTVTPGAVDDTTVIPLNTVTHVGVTVNGTAVRFFVNGVFSSQQTSGVGLTNTDPFYIGWFAGGAAGHYWKGILDDLRLYFRALSDTEMYSLFMQPDLEAYEALRQQRHILISAAAGGGGVARKLAGVGGGMAFRGGLAGRVGGRAG